MKLAHVTCTNVYNMALTGYLHSSFSTILYFKLKFVSPFFLIWCSFCPLHVLLCGKTCPTYVSKTWNAICCTQLDLLSWSLSIFYSSHNYLCPCLLVHSYCCHSHHFVPERPFLSSSHSKASYSWTCHNVHEGFLTLL